MFSCVLGYLSWKRTIHCAWGVLLLFAVLCAAYEYRFKHLSSRLLVASLVSAALSLPRIVVLFLEQWSSLHFRAISPSVLATNYPSAVKALYQPHCRPFTSRPPQSRSVNENLLPAVCVVHFVRVTTTTTRPAFHEITVRNVILFVCLLWGGCSPPPPPPPPKGMNRDWFWKKMNELFVEPLWQENDFGFWKLNCVVKWTCSDWIGELHFLSKAFATWLNLSSYLNKVWVIYLKVFWSKV